MYNGTHKTVEKKDETQHLLKCRLPQFRSFLGLTLYKSLNTLHNESFVTIDGFQNL